MGKPLGLSEFQLHEIQEILKQSLSAKQECKVSFFGSRAKGGFKQYSDLDLWIACKPTLSSTEIANLREKFEDSHLPIKIDIVTPESVVDEYKLSIERDLRFWF